MERIEQILHRIQGIYYDERSKTNIDIDLMLDYTRVLYADLLEWKKNVPKIEIIEKIAEDLPSKNEENTAVAAEQNEDLQPKEEEKEEQASETREEKKNDEKEPQEEPQKDEDKEIEEEKKEEIVPIEEHVDEVKKEAALTEEKEENEGEIKEREMKNEIERDIILEPTEEPANIEKTPDDYFFRERPVLSFELPKSEDEAINDHIEVSAPPVESKQEEKIEEDETEKSEAATKETEEINITEEKEEEPIKAKVPEPINIEHFDLPHSDYANLFSAIQPNIAADIRKYIGLNDRYLFLNELFKNKKTEYEACLNQLNESKNLNEAHQLLATIAAEYNWNKEDETVQGLYTVVSKHFSNK